MFWLLLKCNGCSNVGKWRRQNTAYVDDSLNWCFECDRCFEYTCEYWQDMWDDYYGNVF